MTSITRGAGVPGFGSYRERVSRALAGLGVTAAYADGLSLPVCEEAATLISVGLDAFGREQFLTPEAAERWTALQAAAATDGIDLQLVSAYRSLDYQRGIFERKLAAGTSLEEILRVNAPPGYSEHHTGRAVDVTTPGVPPLSEAFEDTPAFAWLSRQAGRFRMRLSYPRGNRFGVVYEPWHWCFLEGPGPG